MTAAGGIAFWVTDFVIAVSPIAEAYKSAFSITSLPVALVEAFAGGLVIASITSFVLLGFANRILGKTPIIKALFLSFAVMMIIEILATLGDPVHASTYLLLDTGMNVPRFTALGLVVGFLYSRQKGNMSK
jgi:uncharacterized membrane protein